MKIQDAFIVWNDPGGKEAQEHGILRVITKEEQMPGGRLFNHFRYSGGAAWVAWTEADPETLLSMLKDEMLKLSIACEIPIEIVHSEFLKIDEYKQFWEDAFSGYFGA